MSIAANCVTTDLADVSRAGLVQEARIRAAGAAVIQAQGFRASGPDTAVRALSGATSKRCFWANGCDVGRVC